MKIPRGFNHESWQRVGGLSSPSKLPGYAYSLPAKNCLTGAVLVDKKNSTCSGCYALKGRYSFPNVQNAMKRRLKAINDSTWVDDMCTLINDAHAQGHRYFRWHDSGDLQSQEHFDKINDIAGRIQWVWFWLPTRETKFLSKRPHGNLVVRESCHFIDQWYPSKHNNPTSTVHKNAPPIGHVCPAPTQGNTCGACRACWDPKVPNVSYHKH